MFSLEDYSFFRKAIFYSHQLKRKKLLEKHHENNYHYCKSCY